MKVSKPIVQYATVALAAVFGFVGGKELPLGPDTDAEKVSVVIALMAGGLVWYLSFGSERDSRGSGVIVLAVAAVTFWMVLAHYLLGMIIFKAAMSAGCALVVASAARQTVLKDDTHPKDGSAARAKPEEDATAQLKDREPPK